MAKKIFVGELSATTTLTSLNTAFSPWGTIVDSSMDPAGGGAQVEYSSDAEGNAAIANMNLTILDGNRITVVPVS